MINTLERYGFKKEPNENEYKRGDWTIRFDNDQLEIFNNPDKEEGFYYIDSTDNIHMEDLLNDIDDIERNLL